MKLRRTEQLLSILPIKCRYHGTKFDTLGFQFGLPRCDSCVAPWLLQQAKAEIATVTNERFADFTWESRHNKAEQVAACTESGSNITMVNCMGVMRLQREDKNYIAKQLRRAAEMLEGLPE